MNSTITAILDWTTFISFVLLLILYPVFAVIIIYEIRRYNVVRYYKNKVHNTLTTLSNSSNEEFILYFGIFHKQSNELTRWYPELLDLLEHVFSRTLEPNRLSFFQRWTNEEIERFAEIIKTGRKVNPFPSLSSDVQCHIDVVRSLLECSGNATWQPALMNLVRKLKDIESREGSRRVWNRVRWGVSLVTLAFTLLFGIQEWLSSSAISS